MFSECMLLSLWPQIPLNTSPPPTHTHIYLLSLPLDTPGDPLPATSKTNVLSPACTSSGVLMLQALVPLGTASGPSIPSLYHKPPCSSALPCFALLWERPVLQEVLLLESWAVWKVPRPLCHHPMSPRHKGFHRTYAFAILTRTPKCSFSHPLTDTPTASR